MIRRKLSDKVSFLIMMVMILVMLLYVCASGLSPAAAPREDVFLPIIMYHSILKNSARTGTYVITPSELRKDFEYLRANGYQTVLPRDLIAYVTQNTPLPEKCVMLTFDDGHYNNLTYLLPLLEEFSYTAVISVVGKYTDLYTSLQDKNPAYAYFTYSDLVLLEENGRIELANHSYNLHEHGLFKGSSKSSNETTEIYQQRLKKDLLSMQERMVEQGLTRPICYTYPYGIISKESLPVVKECGFTVSLSCAEKPNYITRNPECLYLLNRYNRSGLTTTRAFMEHAGI